MNAKTILAGVVGGVVLFMWGGIVNMATPLGHAGFRGIPNEDAVIDVLRANITQPGMYFFPWVDASQHGDEAAMKAWEEKATRGPAGILIHQIHGEPLNARLLGVELASNIVVGLLAALVLAQIAGSLAWRTLLAGVMGAMASADTLASYWNWYKYPGEYVLAQATIQIAGFLLMGAAIAAIAKKP